MRVGMRSHCCLALLCTALLAVEMAVSSAGTAANTSPSLAVGDVRTDKPESPGSRFIPVPLNDLTLREVTEFLVSELNRRESSTAGMRSTRSVLAASQQSLITGHVYHIKVVVQGGRKRTEVVDAAVLDGKTGKRTVLKVKTTTPSAMDIHDISVMEARIQELHGAPSDLEPVDSVGRDAGFELETEFDAAFLDGIQVESRHSAASDPAQLRSNEATAADAVRHLKAHASLPLPSATGRPRTKSRLTKA